MGREVPERVDIGTNATEIESLTIYIANLPQLAGVDQLFYIPDSSVVNKSVPGHDHEIAAGGTPLEFIDLTCFRGQRLFHKHMFPRFQDPFGQSEMRFSRRRHEDSLHFRIA